MHNKTTRYETFIVKNSTDKTIPNKISGGEVVAWAEGHRLKRLRMFEEVVEKIADGTVNFPQDYATRFLDRMKNL